MGSPYNTNPNILGMNVDADISVPITNPRNDEISIEILKASLTAVMKDGSLTSVNGFGKSVNIPSKETRNINISFKEIPAKYQLLDKPLRLVPLVSSYSVEVRYRGTVKILFGLPYSVEDTYRQTINPKDIPIDEKLFTGFINV